MIFEKVKYVRTYHIVADKIEDAIASSRLKPKDKLPAERELVNQLGVSRRTIREALRLLEQKGLIEMKAGAKGGAFVKKLTTDQVSESLALLVRFKQISLHELAEFRMDVEGLLSARAAERATDDDIKYLKNLLNEAENLLAQADFNWKAFLSVDKRMHLALARAAKNAIYESVLKTVHDNFHLHYNKYVPEIAEKEAAQRHFEQLAEIVKAVENRDQKKAFSIAQKHVSRAIKIMEKIDKKIEIN